MALFTSISGFTFTGKCALGVGLACVGVGGAGAAGALPAPLQHGFSAAISVVSSANDGPTLRTAGEPTTAPEPPQSSTVEPPNTTASPADTNAPSDATTVAPHPRPEPSPEPTTLPSTDGDHGNGERKSPESISLSCSLAEGTVHCSWSGEPLADGAHYILLKTGGDGERGRALFPAAGATNFDDTMLKPGRTLKYMVIVVIEAKTHTLAHSNRVEIHVPAAPGTGPGDNGKDHRGNKPGNGGTSSDKPDKGSGNKGSGGGHDGVGHGDGDTGTTPTTGDGFGNP